MYKYFGVGKVNHATLIFKRDIEVLEMKLDLLKDRLNNSAEIIEKSNSNEWYMDSILNEALKDNKETSKKIIAIEKEIVINHNMIKLIVESEKRVY
jgi:hypothetical protein